MNFAYLEDHITRAAIQREIEFRREQSVRLALDGLRAIAMTLAIIILINFTH